MPESSIPDPEPIVIMQATPSYIRILRYTGIVAVPLVIIILIVLLFAPLDFYLKFYSFFSPQALKVDNNNISWDQLKKELSLVSIDKNLKTRGQKLERAINNSLDLQILRTSVATLSATSSPPLTLFAEHMILKDQVEQRLVNWRTGGLFIAKFLIPEATESASQLQDKAKAEITKIQQKLKKGGDIKNLIKEAEANPTIAYLNKASYLPGMYLEKITPDKFPLHFTTVRDTFFRLKENQVSDIITLKSDDFYDPHNQNSSFELAYVVLRVDKANSQNSANFSDWIEAQKKKVAIQSNVLIPPFFKWF